MQLEGTASTQGCPFKVFKIKWIELFRIATGSKNFKLDAVLEYCKYHKGLGIQLSAKQASALQNHFIHGQGHEPTQPGYIRQRIIR
jgi:hypothetical protein